MTGYLDWTTVGARDVTQWLLSEGEEQLWAERKCLILNGAPRKIRTPNLLIRSQTLYPVELWVHRSLRTGDCRRCSDVPQAFFRPVRQRGRAGDSTDWGFPELGSSGCLSSAGGAG